jgi:diadenosine tetraphosphate (Ap4A) HIT family hydrolase
MAFCVFCEISSGKLPHHLVAEDKDFIAILGIFPNTKGMTVVFPKKHYGSYVFDLDDKIVSKLMLFAKKVAKQIDKSIPTVMRTGMVVEGFGVDHAHVKLFPLHGKKTKNWQPIESSKDEYYEEYPGYISSHDSKRADDKELAKLAKKLRENK